MKPQKEHGGSHRNIRGRKQLALALAVSLWMATGGVASAAQETTVASDYSGDVYGNHTGDDLSNNSGNPNNNTVTVNEGVTASGRVYGSLGKGEADAEGNKVIINGTVTGYVYGGKSGHDADANSNMVTINGEVKASVYGGTGTTEHYQATGNMVTIKGTAWEDVYGGLGEEGATGNSVTVINGTVKKNVYGGYINYNADATSNQVTLSGATVEGNVYGGYTCDYHGSGNKTTNNQVTLNGATVVGNVYGGFSERTGDVTTGNTLYLFGASTAGGAVENFEKIVLQDSLDREYADGTEVKTATYSLAWQDGAALLSAKEFKNCGTLDISAAANLKNATPGTMTLLQSATANNFVNLPLKYWDGTATLTAAGIVVKAGAASNAKNGVTLSYDATHTVKLADVNNNTKNAVTYNVAADPVATVTLGAVAWSAGGTARTLTTEEQALYTFDANTAIDASKLAFTNPEAIAKDASMTLLAGATGITGGHITQPGDGKGEVAVAYTDAKGVKLEAMAKGAVSVDSNDVKYTINSVNLNKATLGSFVWGAEADSMPDGWTASAATTIDATNFEYTGIADGSVAKDTTSTILKAKGLTKDSKVEGGTNIEVAAEAQDGMGIKFEATATGHVEVEVEATEQKVQYRVDSVALKNVDLGGWNGEVSGVPQNWTGSQVAVSTGNFNVPTLAAGQSIDILTTRVANYFGTVSGDRKYSSETFENSEAGVTLSGNHFGGVKVEAYGEAANAKLTYYAETMDTTAIALGEMTWDTGRAAGTGYDFRNVETVTATGLAFTFTDAQKAALSKDSKMTLLSGATNLAADKDVTGVDKTQEIAYATDNGAALTGTLTGEVSTTAGAVNYAATSMTLDSVNLAKWDGKTSSEVPEGWTANGNGVTVATDGMTAPTLAAGTSQDILTTAAANYFSDGKISGANKYQAYDSTPTTQNGVTLSGAESKGVKASDDGKKLVYARSNFNVSNISFGEMTWGVSRDGSAAGNNYAGAAIDAAGLKFADWKPEETAVNASAILLLANDTLPDFTAVSKSFSYSVAPASGVTVDGAVSGSVSKNGNNIVCTATENKASKLTFGAVNWLSEGALLDHAATLANVSFNGAAVDTTDIRFQNLQTAASEDKMTLVSSFGSTIGTVTGTEFSVGKGKGEGHAYLESNDLKYVVTQGVDFNPTGDDNAINEAGDPVGGEIASDVIGGVAQNKGVAENNTMIVLPDSSVTGSVTAAISENGASEKNEAKVTDAKVSGSVTGAEVKGSGTAADNKATVGNTNVGDGQTHTGDVIGAKTDSGLATGNIADVTGGSVEGNVIGAQSDSGTVSTGNKAKVSGANVGGDVYGGVSTDGEANANKAELSGGAVVNGDVYGGVSENKTAAANIVTIENATVEGDVYGGKSKEVSQDNEVHFNGGTVKNLIGGGCETAINNIVTVENGTVRESVYGGKADKDALENHVILSGGTVTEAVYGGWSDSISGQTQKNSVLLYGEADVQTANIFGGNREATGNTLTIGLSSGNTNTPWTGGEQNVKNISNFESISFAVVPWSENKAAVTVTDGSASDLSTSKIDATKVHFTNVDSLKQSDSMTLLDQSRAANKATTVEEKSEFTIGTGVQGKGYLSIDRESGNVLYTVGEMGASEQSHNTVMGLEAGMAALSVGNDFIGDATAGLGLPANEGADGVSTFAKLGGGKLRQTTGSHVDVNTWNAIIAIGKKNRGEKSSFEYGAFFEYGSGNYTTHNGAERGDGSARYTGGGVLAKWTANHGFYVEGSLRAGTVKDDAKNVMRDGAGNPFSYDTSAGYWGFHLGVGKEIEVSGGNTVDVYGKYFYNRRNGVSFDAGGHYDLDAVTSSVLRVGARYTMKREAWNFYGGLAYEYEMDGEAKGKAGGLAIRAADIGGGSARLELGATMTPAKSPWTLDLNLTGFAGKKRGLMGGVSVGFMF